MPVLTRFLRAWPVNFMTDLTFSRALIRWYRNHHRPLPWRTTTDPYKIWISEILLQQTRVAQGMPFYHRFITAFPTVEQLAAAPVGRVLRLWQGLGYYSRARNLHACARIVVKQHNGKFPETYQQLLALPGIGGYTAAAVASLAFRQPVAVVDGNVFRVLARVFGFYQDTSGAAGRKFFFEQANALLDAAQPDVFNQAIMEFGALHCTPRAPKCENCIFSDVCFAQKHGLQAQLPVKGKKQKIKTRYLNYFVWEWKGRLLMRQRQERDIWKGLYDFHLVEGKSKKPEVLIPAELARVQPASVPMVFACRHVLSHQVLHIRFFYVRLDASWRHPPAGLRWYSRRQVEAVAKPVAITRFLRVIGYI